jgi:hypothetical protein
MTPLGDFNLLKNKAMYDKTSLTAGDAKNVLIRTNNFFICSIIFNINAFTYFGFSLVVSKQFAKLNKLNQFP